MGVKLTIKWHKEMAGIRIRLLTRIEVLKSDK